MGLLLCLCVQELTRLPLLSLRAASGAVSNAGWRALAAAVRRNPTLALDQLWGVDLAPLDDTLPPSVAAPCLQQNNVAVLTYYRERAAHRLRTRLATVALLRAAWRRSAGKPAPAAPAGDRAGVLARMLQLRRVCRIRGDAEAVEPFGRAVVAYLGRRPFSDGGGES